ncbi:MAG TPA: hydrogenase maturation nickel metallochaperone HypA [Verrucomicrobiae bacterium]|jgi:hydrogenase nickel incorporation protein HypA/HybF
MHEFSIATQILESVLEFAGAHPGAEVAAIRLAIGELMCVEHEQLRFCFDSIKGGTALENTSLEMAAVRAVVECPHCRYQGAAKYWEDAQAAPVPTLQCPRCGKAAAAIEGEDCAIKSIQLSGLHYENAI